MEDDGSKMQFITKKAAQMAATQGNFERKANSPSENLNQDLFEDLQGRHQKLSSRNIPNKVMATARASNIQTMQSKSPSDPSQKTAQKR
jgi:hypothetical protein